MKNKDIYDSFNEDKSLKRPSIMAVIPRNNDYPFSQERLINDLKHNTEFTIKSINYIQAEEAGFKTYRSFNYDVVLGYKGLDYVISIYAMPTGQIDLSTFSMANTIDDKSLVIAEKQSFMFETLLYFNEDPMTSFHFQLKVLHTILPEASLVHDYSSFKLLSPYWLKMSAESHIPPSPSYLYTTHAVYNELEDGKTEYWMHTHGLNRCGSIELEILNIYSNPKQMYDLLNNTANMFIMDHKKEKEIFVVGYDGLGIFLSWVRWEKALKMLPKNILGGLNDRKLDNEKDYNAHTEPSGILYAVEDGNYISPEIYASTLANNPLLFVKSEETERMSLLAIERFDFFKDAFEQFERTKKKKQSLLGKIFGKKNREEDDWQFLVKLGLVVDEAEDEEDKEHLWFEVIEIDNDKITVQLLNQPYWIKDLNEKDIKTYPTHELLTDWVIYSPEYTYTPDSIYALKYKYHLQGKE